MKPENPKTIVFISGAFLSHAIWEDWDPYFKQEGYRVKMLWWPHKDAPAEVLVRKHPDPDLAGLRLSELLHYFEGHLENMPEKPIVIAEGLAGAVMQLLLESQKIAGCVLINTWPPDGYLPLQKHPLRLFAKALFTLKLNTTFYIPFELWDRITYNQPADYHKCYRYVIPESRKVLWGILTGRKMHYRTIGTPLLFLATDNPFISLKRQHKNFSKYKSKSALCRLRYFPTVAFPATACRFQPEMSDYVRNWLREIGC